MDIQKEREAFEEVFPCSTGTVLNEYGHYESQVNQQDAMIQNISWVVWQAAKAQAVPEGFVLMPKNPTHKMMEASWASLDAGSADEWWDVYEEVMKAAQEPAND